MTEGLEKTTVPGFWDQAAFAYVQTILNSLARATYHREYLRSHWKDLDSDERRSHYRAAEAALNTAQSSADALARWRGIKEEFDAELGANDEQRKAEGDTARAKLDWLDRKSAVIERCLLQADVLLRPKESAQDLYWSFVDEITSQSKPLYTSAEVENMSDDEFTEFVAKRAAEIMKEPEPAPEEQEEGEQDG